MPTKGTIKISVALLLAIIIPLFGATAVYYEAYAETRAQIQVNATRIEAQDKQLARITTQLDRIESLLLERPKK